MIKYYVMLSYMYMLRLTNLNTGTLTSSRQHPIEYNVSVPWFDHLNNQ